MKKIVIYECEDGTRFDEFEQGVLYERFSNSLKRLTIRLLGDRTEDVEKAQCYLEHPIENVKTFRFEICRIAGLYIPLFEKEFNECGNGTRHINHAERIISDYNYKMLNDAFFDCVVSTRKLAESISSRTMPCTRTSGRTITENISIGRTRNDYRRNHFHSAGHGAGTIDESPMVYKPMDEIIGCVEPTVEIVDIIKPMYNFKASN